MQADKNFKETLNVSYTGLILSCVSTLFKLIARLPANGTLLLADAFRSFPEFVNKYVKLPGFPVASIF
ncbi:hypothetical protein EQO05_11290 [Methanosarcina sp. MSH10X1]|uniref:hypothetical protein n=1 Tax=Methanosarcina sp. MSH10X1 TaxID=2507075 RepID=UPI000FFC7835|nr:hypothetical protein [Methanosarcina sp. MSH10X1]RXA18002.1 hypothetical protein EQO05_11290 [Methanosarcina sp. MSH10X1]